MKVVIVGGVAGGATAAARIRRLDEKAQITIFERSGFVSYANCGLPYYIGGVIEDQEELTLQTPESFGSRFRVNVKVLHEVVGIDAVRKKVTVTNLKTGEVFEEGYDKLLLSPGAQPFKPDLKGLDSKRIFMLRTVEDTLRIKEYVDTAHPQNVVIAGGGFIGLEMAENLTELGLNVTIIQSAKQLMNPFDRDMASFIHAETRKHGIRLLLGYSVVGFEDNGEKIEVLADGIAPIGADMVLLAIGVVPDSGLAKSSGLTLGLKGSIVVNEKMQTSAPDIYAVGDAVQVTHFVTGKDSLISLAGPANKQGRIAADNICGIDSTYKGSQGSSIIKIFDLTAACTGINEETAKRHGIDYDKVILSPTNHAGYYPGGKPMTIKIIFEKATYRLLGAQIVGYDGVDKRIDVLATAIRAKMSAIDLKDLDLAYAPPYSSAKDPVNMAGYIIDNIANGIVKQWYLEDEQDLPRDGSVTLLDTRTVGEYKRGHVEGFCNIPVDDLRVRLGELDKDKPVYVICQSGLRSYIATRILTGYGFDAYNFAGGYRFYSAVKQDRAMTERVTPCGMDA